MSDIPNSVWSETDASNTTAAPDGAPEGMAPNGVNDVLRAHQGAIKRWYDWSIPKTTAGTSTAYTLSYTVAPGALVDGMSHMVRFNAVNGAAPTLNVNSLGATPLHFFCGSSWAALPANMLASGQIVPVTYDNSSGAYRCISIRPVLLQTLSGASSVDFTGIPANVNNLAVTFDLTMGSNNVNLLMQFYNSGGSLDSGGSSYYYMDLAWNSDGTGPSVATSTTSSILLAGAASNSANIGVSGMVNVQNIQGVKYTQCNGEANLLNQAGVFGVAVKFSGVRNAVGPITGIKIFPSSGTFTGKATVEMF